MRLFVLQSLAFHWWPLFYSSHTGINLLLAFVGNKSILWSDAYPPSKIKEWSCRICTCFCPLDPNVTSKVHCACNDRFLIMSIHCPIIWYLFMSNVAPPNVFMVLSLHCDIFTGQLSHLFSDKPLRALEFGLDYLFFARLRLQALVCIVWETMGTADSSSQTGPDYWLFANLKELSLLAPHFLPVGESLLPTHPFRITWLLKRKGIKGGM